MSRVIGLFTTKAYAEPASETPLLHRKLRQCLEGIGLIEGSHDYKAAVALFDTFPKDELFAAPAEDLRGALTSLLALEGTQKVRLLGRRDPDGRNASLILTVPQARYDASLVERVRGLFRRRFGTSKVEAHNVLDDSERARVHFLVHAPGELPELALRALEREVVELARTWDDELRDLLIERHGQIAGRRLAEAWLARFPDHYKGYTSVDMAAHDVACLERLAERRGARRLPALGRRADAHRALRVGREGPAVGGDADAGGPRAARARGGRRRGSTGEEDDAVWVQEFRVLGPDGDALDIDTAGRGVAAMLAAVWRGDAESDPLNRLVVASGLDRHQISILRAYRKYRQRIGSRFTESYQNDVLAANPELTAKLVRYFETRFDPQRGARRGGRDGAARGDPRRPRRRGLARPRPHPAQPAGADRRDAAHQRLQARPGGDLVQAALRRRAGDPAAGADVRDLHLLAGDGGHPPARRADRPRRAALVGPDGLPHRGLRADARAADQERDHRPGGRQGRLHPAPRADRPGRAERRRSSASTSPTSARSWTSPTTWSTARSCTRRTCACSTTTTPTSSWRPTRARRRCPTPRTRSPPSTASGSTTRSPPAARSATTTRSSASPPAAPGSRSSATSASSRWTRRWTSSRAVGIGDMSGDVFGNGMLLSDKIRLLAAYDHRHVFIDPDPDPAVSFEERKRLFELAGSSWDDYDKEKISAGGGVFPRAAKSIALSPEARAALGTDAERLAAQRGHPGDPARAGGPAVERRHRHRRQGLGRERRRRPGPLERLDPRQRRRAAGAGRGGGRQPRLHAPRPGGVLRQHGGRVNADFIDNSAGVDCSDHEVNLKILLGLAERRGEMTREQRDELLEAVTEDVVDHVLYDSFLQAQIIGQEVERSAGRMYAYEDLMHVLEDAGPAGPRVRGPARRRGDRRAAARAAAAWSAPSWPSSSPTPSAGSRGRSRPATSSRTRGWSATCATTSRPPVVERCGHLLGEHPLRRQLLCMSSANSVVNALGPTFVSQLVAERGADPAAVVRAYRIARAVTGAAARWDSVERLTDVEPAAQAELMTGHRPARRRRHPLVPDVRAGERDGGGRRRRARGLPAAGRRAARAGHRGAARAPRRSRPTGWRCAACPSRSRAAAALREDLLHAPNMIAVAAATGRDLREVADVFFRIGDEFRLDWLEEELQRRARGRPDAALGAAGGARGRVPGARASWPSTRSRRTRICAPEQAVEAFLETHETQRRRVAALPARAHPRGRAGPRRASRSPCANYGQSSSNGQDARAERPIPQHVETKPHPRSRALAVASGPWPACSRSRCSSSTASRPSATSPRASRCSCSSPSSPAAPSRCCENLRLQDSTRLAGTDELTGLPNRRVFDLRLAEELALGRASWRWRSSTWTASRSSTTRSATAPATSCSPRSARGCRRPSARTG